MMPNPVTHGLQRERSGISHRRVCCSAVFRTDLDEHWLLFLDSPCPSFDTSEVHGERVIAVDCIPGRVALESCCQERTRADFALTSHCINTVCRATCGNAVTFVLLGYRCRDGETANGVCL